MRIETIIYRPGKDSSLGLMLMDGAFVCYTLEDEIRTKKVYGETAIPFGKYKLKLRTHGGLHARYQKRFPRMHKGMIEICDVPEFTDVLIHIGNDDDDTAGCLLVGMTSNAIVTMYRDGFIGSSTTAYKLIYPAIADALLNREIVELIKKRL